LHKDSKRSLRQSATREALNNRTDRCRPPWYAVEMEENPYKSGAAARRYVTQYDLQRTAPLITVFAILNFVLAGVCTLWLLFIATALIYGIGFSGDEGQELVYGVLGCVAAAAPGLLGLVVYFVAGFGLLHRKAWGYYFHLAGAGFAALSCIGIIYTVFAIVFALRPGFSAALFPSGDDLDAE
jgi:hypothetical protein